MITETKPKLGKILVREIPMGMRDKFKSICANHGFSMNEAYLEIIRRVNDGEIDLSKIKYTKILRETQRAAGSRA